MTPANRADLVKLRRSGRANDKASAATATNKNVFSGCLDCARTREYTPAASKAVAVSHHAAVDRLDPQRFQRTVKGPVSRRFVAVQQSRRAEDQRSGANRSDIASCLAALYKKVQDIEVFHHGIGAEAVGDEKNVEVSRAVDECRGGQERNTCVGQDGVERLPKKMRLSVHTESGLRSGKIEQGHVGIQKHSKLKWGLSVRLHIFHELF